MKVTSFIYSDFIYLIHIFMTNSAIYIYVLSTACLLQTQTNWFIGTCKILFQPTQYEVYKFQIFFNKLKQKNASRTTLNSPL